MLKVAVLVSGGGTNLQAILDAVDSGKITNAKYRNVVGISGLYALAHVRSNKECLVEEDTIELRVCVWSRALCVEMVDAYVAQFSCLTSGTKCINKYSWRTCNAAQVYVVA